MEFKKVFFIGILGSTLLSLSMTFIPKNSTWILAENLFSSPWNKTIVPRFLEFNSDSVQTRGMGEDTAITNPYFIESDTLKIGRQLKFKIVEFSDSLLILENKTQYTYLPLPEVSENISKDQLSTLLLQGKWKKDALAYSFSAINENPFVPSLRELKVEKQSDLFCYGSYALSSFKGRIFLSLQLDAVPITQIFWVSLVQEHTIVLSPTNNLLGEQYESLEKVQ